MNINSILPQISEVITFIYSTIVSVIGTITGNPLLYIPVLIAFLGGVIIFSIGIIRRFGIRGVSSTGRRRRR